jgi:hypothetical protein
MRELFDRLNRLWLVGVVGLIVIGAATIYPLIEAWLGPGHGKAALFGGFLLVAYGSGLLTATGIAYLRAVGRPGLEARYGIVLIGLNLVSTVALGLAFGAVGVVAATTVTYAVGTAWFVGRLHRVAPDLPPRLMRPAVMALPLALAAGAVSLALGLASVALLPTGLSLVPIGLASGAAFVAYVSLATGVRLTRENVRALVA